MNRKKKQSGREPSSRQCELRWDVLLKDLSFFVSLCIARFIIWKLLFRQRKERKARLRSIHLVPDASYKTLDKLTIDTVGDRQCRIVIYIAVTIVFFLIALAYVRACEKLR